MITHRFWLGAFGIAFAIVLILSLIPASVSITPEGTLSLGVSGTLAQEGSEVVELRTKNSKTFWLGGSTYELETSLAAVHYLSEEGDWQDIDCDYSVADSGNYTARFVKLPYLVRMGDDSTRRIYPDRNDLSYWIELGKPFPSMGAPTKVGGYWVWNFAHAAIGVKIRPQAIKVGFRLKDNLAPSSITIPFSSYGVTRNGNEILHNGEVVGYLQKPTAIDANGVEVNCQVTFGSGTITISLDTTGLVYPIDIDPTFAVGASTDDCRVYSASSTWTFDYNSNFMYVGYSSASINKYGGGLRFQSVTIPQGATINSAYLTFVCGYSQSAVTVNSYITGNDVDDAATWSTTVDYQNRRGTVVGGANNNYITAAQVSWDNVAAWTEGTSYNSPSIVSIIQEIVNRAGWASGNNLALWWDDHNGRSTALSSRVRMGASWDNTTYNPPSLTITYTAGCSPSITNDPSSWSVNGGTPVAASSNYATGLTYFTITNNSGGAVSITIGGTDMTGGGYTWDLDDGGSAGDMIYALKAGLSGGDYTIIVRETASYNTLVAGLADEGTQDWGLKLWTPTNFNDGNGKSGTITLTATCD